MTERLLPVPDGLEGERIDIALTRMMGLSRTKTAELIDSGGVSVDGRLVNKGQRLAAGQVIGVNMSALDRPPALVIVAEPIPGMRILFDDDDIVVVDKPVGVAAHPSEGFEGPTVVGGLEAAGYRISSSGAQERQGIVHRLDVGTSGVMAVAKSERAYTSLKRQFKERTVDKDYHAVVQGLLDPLRGTIDAPIGRHPSRDYRFAVVAGGKDSVTHYETLEAFAHGSLVEVHLETGRTHQIRVHVSAMRHPCVGDVTYGADPTLSKKLGLERQWLHAMRLGFEHPATGDRIVVSSEYPQDLVTALERLRDGA
jgi:23S rRNA pseudouridine1911/1915/1917 synthase